MSFKLKLFTTFVFYGFALVLFTQLIIFKINELSIKSASVKKASEIFIEKNNQFDLYIKDTRLKLTSIKKSELFNSFLDSKVSNKSIENLFLNIANTADNIMQIRYIGNNGDELIRVDRKTMQSDTYIVSKAKLQNKSNRYYMKEILSKAENHFWYSKIDLNMEYEKIEKPIKPVIRIGTPIFHNGEKVGVLIINIFMKKFLTYLIDSTLFDIYLFDKDGYILVDSLHNHCWNRYLDLTQRKDFDLHFEEDIEAILKKNEYYGDDFYTKKIFLNNGEKLYLVVKPKRDYIQNEIKNNMYQLGWVMLIVILLSIPFSYFFAKTPVRLKEKVDSQKKDQDVLLSLFDLSNAVLFKWNNDETWSVNYVSKSVNKLLGYTHDEFKSNQITYSGCIYPKDLQQVMDEVTQAVEQKLYYFEHKPYRILDNKNNIKWILDSTVIVRDKNGDVINFIGYLSDITELKNNELKLIKISRTDQLTKISNRLYLDEILQNQYYRFYRDTQLCSIILIDIDHFKSVNDNYGHIIGDTVLKEFATLLKSSMRDGDVLGRWGGEEFLIILPDTNLNKAITLANQLKEKVFNKEFSIVKHKTASFGISTFEDDMSVELLLDKADKALYKSKENGRNCVTTIQTQEN